MKTLLQIITILSIFVSCSKEGSNPVNGNINNEYDTTETSTIKQRIITFDNNFAIKAQIYHFKSLIVSEHSLWEDTNKYIPYCKKENYDTTGKYISTEMMLLDSTWELFKNVVDQKYYPSWYLLRPKSKNGIDTSWNWYDKTIINNISYFDSSLNKSNTFLLIKYIGFDTDSNSNEFGDLKYVSTINYDFDYNDNLIKMRHIYTLRNELSHNIYDIAITNININIIYWKKDKNGLWL